MIASCESCKNCRLEISEIPGMRQQGFRFRCTLHQVQATRARELLHMAELAKRCRQSSSKLKSYARWTFCRFSTSVFLLCATMRNKKQDREKPLILRQGKLQEKEAAKHEPLNQVLKLGYHFITTSESFTKGQKQGGIESKPAASRHQGKPGALLFCFKFSESETKQCQTTEEPQTQKNRPE